MRIFIFILICLFTISGSLYSQNIEKSISNQSLLIDALKEIQIGNKEKANQILQDLKHEPECKAVSNFLISKILRSEGKIEEAIEAINLAIFSEPNNIWYLKLKVSMTEEFSRDLETAETYEKMAVIEENQFSHFDNAAYFYLKADEFKKAMDILNRAEIIFGIQAPIAIKKSFVFCFLKKEKNAVEVLENAHSKFPANIEILAELINTLSVMKKTEQVNKYIDKLKPLDPTNSVLLKFSPGKDNNKSNQQQDNLYQKIESKDISLDDKIKLLFLQLNDHVNKTNTSGIQSMLIPVTSLRKQYPDNSKTSALLADIHFQLNDLQSAKKEYIQSILEGTVPYAVWDNLLFCLIKLNHWKTAKYFSEKCMDLYPNQSFPNYVNILCNFKLNKTDNLLSQLNQLEMIVSHNIQKKTEVLILKAKLLYTLNQKSESTNVWKTALESDHDYLATLEYCIFTAANNEFCPKEYVDKAMRSDFIHELFKSDKAAELYYYTKDFKKAKLFIDASILNGNAESFETIELAAKIYEALGDKTTAMEYTLLANKLIEKESFEQLQLLLEPK